MSIIAFVFAWISGVCALLALMCHAGARDPELGRDLRILRMSFSIGAVACAAIAGGAWWVR